MQHLQISTLLSLTLAACSGAAPASTPGDHAPPPPQATLVLAAYTTPREALSDKILPAFTAKWKAEHQQDLTIQQSYQGSGAQARAVVAGLEADVVQLSLDPDVQQIADAGLLTRDWHAAPHAGIVTQSLVVIAVREGNPSGIHDWADLARPGLAVLTPNVRTSGGAMWNVAAIYGAALRGHIAGVPPDDTAAAERFLATVLHNVKVMDKSGRDSLLTFESGVGDVAITYENEVLVARQSGQKIDYVVPASTLLIEMPVAVVDGYATKHGTTAIADALVAYLFTADAQKMFVAHGYRSADASLTPPTLPAPADLFTIRDLGGWKQAHATLFAKGAAYDRSADAARGDR